MAVIQSSGHSQLPLSLAVLIVLLASGSVGGAEPLERLLAPSQLLPLHQWSAKPRKRRLQLSDGTVVTLKLLHKDHPRIFEVGNFIANSEAANIIELSRNGLADDMMGDAWGYTVDRTSRSKFWRREEAPIIDVINARAADVTRIPLSLWQDDELLSIVQYTKGGRYDAHWDTTSFASWDRHIQERGQPPLPGGPRFITLLVFLNNVTAGGETIFPIAGWSKEEQSILGNQHERQQIGAMCKLGRKDKGIKVRPRLGKALLWYNHFVTESGTLGDMDPLAWHAACELKAGEKWAMNRWIPVPISAVKGATSSGTEL